MNYYNTNTTLIAGTSALVGAVATYLFLNRKPLQSSPPPHTVTVTYWNGRGLAESVRLTLAASGIPFTHVVPGFENATHLDQPEHLQHLRTQTNYLIAGQVPLLRINGTSYVQSMATVRMLARRFGLSGATPTETTTVDIIAECIKDWRNSIGGSWEFGMGGFEPTKDMCLKVKQGNLKYLPILERILTTHRYVGQTVAMSYADVLAFEQLEQLVEGKHIKAEGDGTGFAIDYPKLNAYYNRIRSNENIANYLASDMRLNKGNQQEIKDYIASVKRTLGR